MSNILFYLYDFIFILGFLLYLPVCLCRKKINLNALKEKFGFIAERKTTSPAIWIHAVSVGEVMVIEGLIEKLIETVDSPLIISTTTLTGNKIAKEKYSSIAKIIFFPYDITTVLRKVLRIINPRIFIAVETEIWPNLFYRLNKKNIPIVIINGRISQPAFKQYRRVKPLIRNILKKCAYLGVQNASYRQKFIALGAEEDKIIVSGNMKFESTRVDQKRFLSIKNSCLPYLKKDNNLILLAGSTHHPEEKIILDIYKDILKEVKNITLVLAPRHIERIPSLEKTIKDFGFNPARISRLNSSLPRENDVFLVDVIGQLLYFYGLSDICFIGGSLIPHGGQNILEPIYFLKPTIFGPYMDNFPDIEEIVLNKSAGIKVSDAQKLKEVVSELVKDRALRDNLRGKCIEVFEEEKRGLEKNLHIILNCLHTP